MWGFLFWGGFFFPVKLSVLSDCKISRIRDYWLSADSWKLYCILSHFSYYLEKYFLLYGVFSPACSCSYRHAFFLFSMLFVDPAPLFSCAAFTVRLFPSLPNQLIQTRLDHIGAIFFLSQDFVSIFPFNPL